MADRIDHAAEAVALLRRVSGSRMSDAEASVSVSAAQVHATLAVAEQQRIANLIALESARSHRTDRRGHYWGPDLLWEPGPDPEGNAVLRPEIARALGVEVPDGR